MTSFCFLKWNWSWKDAGSIQLRWFRPKSRKCLTLWQKRTFRKRSKNGEGGGTGVYIREGTTSRVTAADRPYGKFYDFYSVSLETFVSTHVQHFIVQASRSLQYCRISQSITVHCTLRCAPTRQWREGFSKVERIYGVINPSLYSIILYEKLIVLTRCRQLRAYFVEEGLVNENYKILRQNYSTMIYCLLLQGKSCWLI